MAELVERAFFDYLSLFHYIHIIEETHEMQAVQSADHALVGEHGKESLEDDQFGAGVHIAGRLIEQYDGAVADREDATCQRKALLLTAGKIYALSRGYRSPTRSAMT